MAYSMNHGLENDGLDRTQRGLLVGLPAIALMLSFGVIHKHSANNPSVSAHTIPVVSSLNTGSVGGGKGNGSGSNPGSGNQGSGSTAAPGQTFSTQAAPAGGTTTSSGTSSGGGVIGGMGGGPTGGGTTSGGTTSLPDCSIGQIATVNCLVTACSPPVTLAPGQKAILGVNGTCVIVN